MKPDFERASESFQKLCETIATLRDPENGCPWDLKQSHKTLAKYLIEEAYEACEVLEQGTPPEICDELGDVLLQVVLNAQIASDNDTFEVADVVDAIQSKMIRRHPHVFGSDEQKKERGLDQIMKNWHAIKKKENGEGEERKPLMKEKKVHKVFPSTSQAYKIGQAAKSISFDWESPDEVWDVFRSEVKELEDEWHAKERDLDKLKSEIGDVYFTLAQMCRHLGWEPELVSQQGNNKFLKRFALMEKLSQQKGKDIRQLSREQLEKKWEEAKNQSDGS